MHSHLALHDVKAESCMLHSLPCAYSVDMVARRRARWWACDGVSEQQLLAPHSAARACTTKCSAALPHPADCNKPRYRDNETPGAVWYECLIL
jgi:hypothetical protein